MPGTHAAAPAIAGVGPEIQDVLRDFASCDQERGHVAGAGDRREPPVRDAARCTLRLRGSRWSCLRSTASGQRLHQRPGERLWTYHPVKENQQGRLQGAQHGATGRAAY